MQSCSNTALSDRVDARTYLFNTVQVDYRPALVRVNEERIRELEFPKGSFMPMSTALPGTPPGGWLDTGIAYLLLLNSQNFQFWDIVDGEFVRYAYDGIVGAMGMRRAFDKAWGDDVTSDTFRVNLASKGVEGLFGNISQPAERATILEEMLAGNNLQQLSSQLSRVALEERKFTLETARMLADTVPRSYAEPYFKRAQLVLAEIAGSLASVMSSA